MMRKAFGLVQALLVIILISGIMVIAMKYAKVSLKQTGDLYAKESAELFMDSTVEMALLAISGYERNATTGCLSDVHIISEDKRYVADVNITHYYLLQNSQDCTVCGSLCMPVLSEESHGMAMLELSVFTNDAHPKNTGKKIRLTRRTLQRP